MPDVLTRQDVITLILPTGQRITKSAGLLAKLAHRDIRQLERLLMQGVVARTLTVEEQELTYTVSAAFMAEFNQSETQAARVAARYEQARVRKKSWL